MNKKEFGKLKVGDKVKLHKIDDPIIMWNQWGEMNDYDGNIITVTLKSYDIIRHEGWSFSYDCLELYKEKIEDYNLRCLKERKIYY